jgi:hypothetical protein
VSRSRCRRWRWGCRHSWRRKGRVGWWCRRLRDSPQRRGRFSITTTNRQHKDDYGDSGYQATRRHIVFGTCIIIARTQLTEHYRLGAAKVQMCIG